MSEQPTIRLAPDQLAELADLVAERISERRATARLVGPRELAEEIGKSPQWIREHYEELGGSRDGDGPRPRYVFPLDVARDRLRAMGNGTKPAPAPKPKRRRRRRTNGDIPLLPVRGAK